MSVNQRHYVFLGARQGSEGDLGREREGAGVGGGGGGEGLGGFLMPQTLRLT